MSDFHSITNFFDTDAPAYLLGVTDLTLVSHHDDTVTSLEEADAYAIHSGLPDRADHPRALGVETLVDALKALEQLQQVYPDARLWLSTSEIQTEMLGDSVWEAIVFAQAEIDEDDEDCHWVTVSRLICRADTYQESLGQHLKEWVQGLDGEPDVPHEILCRL